MKLKTIRWIASAVILLTSLGQALAATRTWDGGLSPYTGTSWNDAVNWAGDIKPVAGDNAVFNLNPGTGLTTGKVIALGAPQSIYKLDIPSWANATTFTLGNSTDVASGNTLTLTYAYLGPNYNNDVTITANVVLGDDSIWDTAEDVFIINGNVSGSGKDFAKWGANSVSLRGANTYTGDTILNVGTLRLDFGGPTSPASDIVDPLSPLVLKSGLLAIKAKASSSRSQNFDTATASTGASSINLESASGANVLLSFDNLNPTTGATLNLKQPTGNTAINASNGYTAVNTNDASGILGAYLTVMPQDGTAPADWAMNNGVNIVAYNNYATLSGAAAIIANNVTNNVQVNNTTTGTVTLASSNVTINTLKASGTTARLMDLGSGTLRLGASGGILTPGLTGALTLTNGTLTAGGADNTAGEIVVVNTTTITNNAVIADNGSGAVAFTKSGAGLLRMTTATTHTGGTYVNGGTFAFADILTLAATATKDSTTVTLTTGNTTGLVVGRTILGSRIPDGTTISSITSTTQFKLSKNATSTGSTTLTTCSSGGITNPISATGSLTVNGGFVVLGPSSTLALSGPATFRGGTVLDGTITKSGAAYDVQSGAIYAILGGSVGLVKTSPASATFTGANTYTGDTYVLEGSATFNYPSAIVKGNLFVGSPTGIFPASVSCVDKPLTDTKNWTVYKNGSLNSGASAQYLAAKLTIIGGYFTGSQPYFNGGSSVEMTGGTLAGSLYGNSGFEIKSLSNSTPAVVSAYLAANSHKFTVSRGSGPIDLIFSGSMTGANTLTKEGNGVMTMSGSGHSSGTVLNAGTLLAVNTTGSGTGTGAVTVKAGTTFGGTGFIVGSAANVTATGAIGNEAFIAPGKIDSTTGDHILGTLTIGSGAQANNMTFAAYSTLKINFNTNGVCDKLVVNGTLSLNTTTDKLVLNIDDYDALKAGTYTLATFTSLATPATKFDLLDAPSRGSLVYTPTSLEYIVHRRGTVLVVR